MSPAASHHIGNLKSAYRARKALVAVDVTREHGVRPDPAAVQCLVDIGQHQGLPHVFLPPVTGDERGDDYAAGEFVAGPPAPEPWSGSLPDAGRGLDTSQLPRFTRTISGFQIPYVVAGCGGHPPLSRMRTT